MTAKRVNFCLEISYLAEKDNVCAESDNVVGNGVGCGVGCGVGALVGHTSIEQNF